MYFFSLFTSPVSRHRAMTLPVLVALSLSTAMAQSTPTPPLTTTMPATALAASTTVLARGPGGVIINVSDVLSELQRAPEATRKAVLSQPEAIGQIANNLLVRRVLANEAQRDGLDKDTLVAASLAVARDRALSDARLASLDQQNTPSEAALDAYARNVYQANVAKFEKPAQTRARHILLANSGPDSLQKAKDILAQLRAGASFEELAKSHSTDTGSAARGGDLGFFGPGKMVRPFEDAVNSLAKPGDLSEPIESQFGYHIIRLDERREKAIQPFAEVRAQLLGEARAAILNEARVQKVQTMNKDFVFDEQAIEGLTKQAPR